MTSGNSNAPPKTILFDFDGTLVNTTPLILRSYQATWEVSFGFTFDDEVYIETFGTHLRASIGALIDLGVRTGQHAPPRTGRRLSTILSTGTGSSTSPGTTK